MKKLLFADDDGTGGTMERSQQHTLEPRVKNRRADRLSLFYVM